MNFNAFPRVVSTGFQSARDSRDGAPETMRDVNQDPGGETPYECFECGNIIVTTDNPGQCPDCAGEMRNRRTPLE